LDRTCGNLEQVLRHVVTPWQVTSRFPGLFLRNLSIGLGIGVDTSFVCQVLSPIFRRSHIRCRHLLQSEAEEIESCSGWYWVSRVRVETWKTGCTARSWSGSRRVNEACPTLAII